MDVQEYSPLTLAYIGDGIYDLVIRTLVINRGNKQVQKLHQETSALVPGVRAVADDACSSG